MKIWVCDIVLTNVSIVYEINRKTLKKKIEFFGIPYQILCKLYFLFLIYRFSVFNENYSLVHDDFGEKFDFYSAQHTKLIVMSRINEMHNVKVLIFESNRITENVRNS